MRVLLSGGGVAGLTLASRLHQHGIVSVVIERASDLSPNGYAIDFFDTCYKVAERMGLLDRLFAQQIAFEGIEHVNAL